jgi:uncharacterized membrane protein YeaQ/YmgE (transglycosylase-associated protein family)
MLPKTRINIFAITPGRELPAPFVVIIIGVGIGTMVELLLPGHHATELLLAVLLGVMGALLARYVGQAGGWYGSGEPGEFLGAGLGAVIVLLLYGALFRRDHRGQRH